MPTRKTLRSYKARIGAAALSAAAVGAAVVLPASNAEAAQCWFGSCFSYVTGQQSVSNTGASVTMYQAAPTGVASDGHSLQELALQSTPDTTVANTIEVGWTVDPSTNGDYQPHLFVFHWVNGQGTCYNGCGFVQVSSTVRAGMALQAGTSATFGLRYYSGNWWVLYNNTWFGYFPGSLWGGAFTSANSVSAFGEVAADKAPSCTDMGDGAYGSSGGASWISNFQLYGAGSAPRFTVKSTDPSYYNSGSVTATSFTLGGPGAC